MAVFNAKNFAPLLSAMFLLAAAGFSTAAGLQGNRSADRVGFPVIEVSPEQLANLHQGFQAEVEAGNVALETGRQAQDIWIALQRYLADQEAKLQRLESRVMEPADSPRLKAVREMARNVAERERVLISAYFALKKIVNGSPVKLRDLHHEKNNRTQAAEKTDRRRSIEIEISPTDALMEDLE